MNNRASINQVFTFLMVAILIGLLFLFGIKAMKGMMTDTCEADRVLVIKEVETYLNKYNIYGSIKQEQVALPCDYTQICFVDKNVLGKSADKIKSFNNQPINPMIKQSIEANISYNVFLLKENVAEPILYSDNLVIDSGENGDGTNYVCLFPVGNQVKLTFLGNGKTIAIGLPEQEGTS